MHRAAMRWLLPAVGAAAALTLVAPVGAQAATSAAATSASISPSNCFAQFLLQNAGTSENVYIDTSADDELAFGAPQDVFCQTRISSGSSVVEIFDESAGSSGQCLAWNGSENYVYLHAVSGCDSGLSYTEWKFIYIKTVDSIKVYEIQNQDNSECIYEHNPAQLDTCESTNSRDLFNYIND